jgi:hypothetical protein
MATVYENKYMNSQKLLRLEELIETRNNLNWIPNINGWKEFAEAYKIYSYRQIEDQVMSGQDLSLFQKSIEKGNVTSYYYIGLDLIEKNLENFGLQTFKKGHDLGCPMCSIYLANECYTVANYDLSYKYIKNAFDKGEVNSYFMLFKLIDLSELAYNSCDQIKKNILLEGVKKNSYECITYLIKNIHELNVSCDKKGMFKELKKRGKISNSEYDHIVSNLNTI